MYFKDIIGQEHVIQYLIKSVKDFRVSHALLFTGGTGNGKLPLAIAFAGYIFCQNRGEADRCGHCKSCKEMDANSHPDLHYSFPFVKTDSKKTCRPYMREFVETISKDPYLSLRDWEIQIASDNKKSIITADESNEIIKDLSLKSFAGGYKVLIIWHADKLGTAAQNKLLKTLEEPEAKTLIILITESPEELLPTINSRTQLVKFNHLRDEQIAGVLQSQFGLSSTGAMNIARVTDGNYTLARKMASSNISTSVYLDLFSRWMRAAATGDYNNLITACDAISKLSRDEQQNFLEYGLHFLHQSLLHEYVGVEEARFDEEAKDFARKFAPFMVKQNLEGFQNIFSTGHYLVKRSVNPHLLFLKMGSDMIRLFKEHTHQPIS